jgi:SAM-dependent methyltransferase
MLKRHHAAVTSPEGASVTVSRMSSGVTGVIRRRLKGELPARYAADAVHPYAEPFWGALRPHLRPGLEVLDVGSGRRPIVRPVDRLAGWTYVGLDIDISELERAGPEGYDDRLVGDIIERDPAREERFDLVISRFLLEHVNPIDAALENMRRALKPGGQLVSLVPGRFAPFSLLNQILPATATQKLLQLTIKRDPTSVFPAYYDRCWHSALKPLMAGWSEGEVTPVYASAQYLRFSRVLQAGYLGLEELTLRARRPNLASYYVISATR